MWNLFAWLFITITLASVSQWWAYGSFDVDVAFRLWLIGMIFSTISVFASTKNHVFIALLFSVALGIVWWAFLNEPTEFMNGLFAYAISSMLLVATVDRLTLLR